MYMSKTIITILLILLIIVIAIFGYVLVERYLKNPEIAGLLKNSNSLTTDVTVLKLDLSGQGLTAVRRMFFRKQPWKN